MRGSPLLLVALGSLLLATTACGAPVEQNAAQSPATDLTNSVTTVEPVTTQSTTTSSSLPRETVAVTTTTAPDAMTRRWLYPSSDPQGMHLISAPRQTSPCGIDCDAVVASATLVYYTDDTTTRRSLGIVQSMLSQSPGPPDSLDNAPERVAGDRHVRVVEGAGDIRAAWTEPDGDVVHVESVGIGWDELAVIIGGLETIDPAAWPTVTPPPTMGFCVDASSRIAPTTPDGWQRFVLQATGG